MERKNGSPTRRDLARALAAASGAALLPLPARGAEDPAAEAVLALSPAPLDPAERMDVRNGVRSLAKALAEARKKDVPNDVDPAFVYLPSGGGR